MIEFEGKRYELAASESVLDCLQRNGVALSASCRGGVCQTCMLKAARGVPPVEAQAGLKSSQAQQGFFLACLCRPRVDLVVERLASAVLHECRVLRVEPLSPDVFRVWLSRPPSFSFRAGQFAQLLRPADGLMRPYSIASLPDEEALELHVARLSHGKMSGWLEHAEGEVVQLAGPYGECFYQEGESERPLLLAGTGTGVSPLAGILKQAARRQHRGRVTLFHGSPKLSGLYLRAELEGLARSLPTLQLVGSVLSGADSDVGARGAWWLERAPLDQLLFSQYPKLNEHRLYFCGNSELVRKLRKHAYLAGASLSRIHADPFAAAA